MTKKIKAALDEAQRKAEAALKKCPKTEKLRSMCADEAEKMRRGEK